MQASAEPIGSLRADILVVDDNPANIELLVAILGGHGYRCRVANSGARALAAARADVPDLVMLDIAMPGIDGYEVCRQLKADAATRAVPVIFLSALNGVIDKVQAFAAGGADYIGKPFQLEEVIARVESQVRVSRMQREVEERNAELGRVNAELLEATQRLEAGNARLRKLSESDGLTGVANRRLFDGSLIEAWTASVRSRREIALILIDIDHFKEYNDASGHLAGDDCLKRVAQALESEASAVGALVARYGGEEFSVLLPDPAATDARALAEALRARVEFEALPHPRSDVARVVTVSVGVAVMAPTAAHEPALLIDAADQALYRAKAAGRNRTSI
ncbi:MAG: diguanylate cyclase [Xanthomonadales bacterium]|jgi:diguanylate cyclase (GGDEF)-like protein|nr:diguanylate cyclase [Xanthomonadales bacterium]MBP6078548.1 diguanylate cyclase [Xanthomonadales bacterium]MBP7624806.1 diguanylate cyclase [Xanthomonadales bacterium]